MNSLKDMNCMTCDDGFMVQSKDEKEVMEMGKMHVKNTHKINTTDTEMMERMKACKLEMEKISA